MNIAFWSNVSGRSGTSGNMLAVGIMTSVLYSLKTMLVQTDCVSRPIDEALESRKADTIINEELYFYSRKGMDELIERGRRNLLTGEMVETNVVNVKHTNIYYIPSAKEKSNSNGKENIKIYETLMNKLNNMGNLNFWDVLNGENSTSKAIMEKSDVVVVNLCQEAGNLGILRDNEGLLKKAVFLIGKYDSSSRKSFGNICKEYGISKDNTGIISYNIHFHDAVNEGRAVPFIMKNIFAKKHEANFEFINNLFKATNLVLKKAGVEGIEE